jgi:hypothetical protein
MAGSEPEIEFTRHALERMWTRRISERNVRITIMEPTRSSREYDEPQKWAFRRHLRGKVLVVIAYVRGNDIKVKTVYYE